MRAIDTNVAARFLMRDDVRQASVATEVIMAGVHVPLTVLLELTWLLGSSYAQPREVIAATLTDFLDIEFVHVDDPVGVAWAIDRYAEGADLADMLHLVAAAPATRFATFDRGIARHAAQARIAVDTLA